jgi:hypothetical protein
MPAGTAKTPARYGSVHPVDEKDAAEDAIDLQRNQPGSRCCIQERGDRFRSQQKEQPNDDRRENRDRQPRQAHHAGDRLKGAVDGHRPDDGEPQCEGDGDGKPDGDTLAHRKIRPRQT